MPNFHLWRFINWLRLFRPKRTQNSLTVRYRPITPISVLKVAAVILPLLVLSSTYLLMFIFVNVDGIEPAVLPLLCIIFFLLAVAWSIAARALTSVRHARTIHTFDANENRYLIDGIPRASFKQIDRIFIEKRMEGGRRHRYETYTVTIEISAESPAIIGKTTVLDQAIYIADDIAEIINKQIIVGYSRDQ